ncbi:MAG: DUF2490 domain-containing protein, partial [Chitinophagaceae bacterium]
MERLRVYLRSAILAIVILTGTGAAAQTTFNGWFASNNTFKLNKKFGIHLDVQARSTDKLEHLSTFIFRPGINWSFRKNMVATLGYGYFQNRRTLSEVSGYVPEHRIWQQLVVNHSVGFVPIQHRFRLEQRFISTYEVQNGDLKVSGNNFANSFCLVAALLRPGY